YKWFALAAKEGDVEAARKRDEMALQLDDDTLAAADLAVKNWRPEPQPDDAIKVKTPPGGWDSPRRPSRSRARKAQAFRCRIKNPISVRPDRQRAAGMA